MKASIDTSVSSAGSMQTPPPTSTSASRRKAQQAQVTRLANNPSSQNGRRMSSPALAQNDLQQPPTTLTEESPLQFPNLQFSPDGFSFPASGPATAPVYPQHKLFWDPEQNTNAMNVDMSMDDTFSAFGITSQRFPDSFVTDENLDPFTTLPATSTFQSSAGISQPTHASALNQTNLSPSKAVITSGSSSVKNRGIVVNPSLLFSSPSRAPIMQSASVYAQATQDDSMQPYAQQVKDAQFEREMKARKQKRKRPPELGESPAVTMATAALRDDSTSSSKSSPVIADSFFGALPEGPPQLDRGMPNRKRMTPDNHYQKHGGQASISRRRSNKASSSQPAVTLKIDENGRAITETSFIKSSQNSKMDVDSDSDSSDSSSMSARLREQEVYGRPKSSNSRRARFADDPYSHSQKSSDASTLASGRSASRLQGRLSMNAGHAQVHFPPSASQNDDSEVSTVVDTDEEKGDAQSELKKLVRQRSFGKKTNKRSSFTAAAKQSKAERRVSYAPEVTRPTPYFKHNHTPSKNRYPDPLADSSPTTIPDPDLATPSTGGGSSIGHDSTRCICGTADGNGQLMIQWYDLRALLFFSPFLSLCSFSSTPNFFSPLSPLFPLTLLSALSFAYLSRTFLPVPPYAPFSQPTDLLPANPAVSGYTQAALA